ncbi:MAG: hypothetical protein LBL59_02305 [Xanthomonadaceae bacterium]|jgi:hypothetical protein|nr:hypothetical protein [Xanthomonadaceae bacterium]
MKTPVRWLLAACMAAVGATALSGCKKDAPQASTQAAPQIPPVPARDDDAGWKLYLQAVVGENLGTITNSPFLYYLPPQSDPDFETKFGTQVEKARLDLSRGVQKDNLLAFGSPASAKMAELIEMAFQEVPVDSMKGVHIMFIGDAADDARAKTAVLPSGADYQFIEAK